MINEDAPQLQIIHLSDLHFGTRNRFVPARTPAGDVPGADGFPDFLEKLREDWQEFDALCPVIVCITGDITTTASEGEFSAATDFIRRLKSSSPFGCKLSERSVFVVPGNHDVLYELDSPDERMRPWVEFYNEVYGARLLKKEHRQTAQLHDRFDDLRAYILTINSTLHVQKGKPDGDRGNVDVQQLKAIQDQLKSVPEDRLRKAIKLALLHHHPVLIPPMAEPGRGYDAVHNSGKLLTILRRYGFHLILHGHKHNPHTFTDDTRGAFTSARTQPLLIVAGGSAGSIDLPESPRKGNTYNRVTVKWHPDARQSRVAVETRRLTVFEEDGSERLPLDWSWETIDTDDRSFYASQRLPESAHAAYEEFDESTYGATDEIRRREYKRLRGNMPVHEVLPALEADQAYEVRMWIVPHDKRREMPVSVTWAAGDHFDTATIRAEDDPNFCAAYTYWGPFVVQTQVRFADGAVELWHMYVRMPAAYSSAS